MNASDYSNFNTVNDGKVSMHTRNSSEIEIQARESFQGDNQNGRLKNKMSSNKLYDNKSPKNVLIKSRDKGISS